ncbi:MAG: guanylate kinase [Firmicutes bacterium]|nr:guanylate kinase [Bacillota bacterium]
MTKENFDLNQKTSGLMFVLSGPSGVGKGTVYNIVLEKIPQIKRSISVTTRSPRQGEIDGVNYHFKSLEQYQQLLSEGAFLETAAVFDNHYGTLKAPVFDIIDDGFYIMFEIDVEGAKQIKNAYPDCIQIFLMPPDIAELESRLRGRGTESEEGIKTRLGGARREMEQFELFDYVVVNNDLNEAVGQILSIIDAEKQKTKVKRPFVLNFLGK